MSSILEQKFADLWLELYPHIDLHQEYRFHPVRLFRFDFAHLQTKTGIELQGGIWMKSAGHNTGGGLTRDYTKLNLATANGWKVFMLSADMVTADWLGTIARTLESSTWRENTPKNIPKKPKKVPKNAVKQLSLL